MSHIILQEGLVIDDDVRQRIETFYAWPNEQIVLDPEARWDGEDSDENDLKVLQISGPLVVDELHVIASVEGNGFVDIVYKIKGMEGLHNAHCFMNPEGVEHCYGTLITREGQAYLVPMEGNHEHPVAGAPKLIDPDMSRSAKYNFNIDGEKHTVEGYLSGHDAEPATGEYYIIPTGDNHYQLTNSPWMAVATEHELNQSELSIAQYKESAMHIDKPLVRQPEPDQDGEFSPH